jgi:uncharacterized membrane protein
MIKYLAAYGLTFIVFLIVDIIYLGFIAKGLYERHIGFLMAEKVNWWAAIIFYLLFVAAIFVFVINPAVAKNSWRLALVYGAFFGFITYATYDLTNLATLKDWPVRIVIYDMIWGTILAATVGLSGFYITKWLH